MARQRSAFGTVGRLIGKLLDGASADGGLPLRAYGKLPMYIEYRRLECSQGPAAHFSQWIDAGYQAWSRRVRPASSGLSNAETTALGAARGIPPRRLVWVEDGGRDCVVACVWASRDSGGREFPFSLFVTLAIEQLGAEWPERFASLVSLWQSLCDLWGDRHLLGPERTFERVYGSQRVDWSVESARSHGQLLVKSATEVSASRYFSDARLGSNAQSFPGVVGCSRPGFVLRFPLIERYDVDVQALAWVQWLTRQAGPERIPTVILPARDCAKPACGQAFLRAALPEDFVGQASPMESCSDVTDFCLAPGAEHGTQTAITASVPADGTSLWQWACTKV